MKTQGSWNWTFPGNFHLFWFFPGCFLVELVLEIAIYKLLELQLVSRKNLRTQNKKKQNKTIIIPQTSNLLVIKLLWF